MTEYRSVVVDGGERVHVGSIVFFWPDHQIDPDDDRAGAVNRIWRGPAGMMVQIAISPSRSIIRPAKECWT